jgi:hypothetical protein
VARNFGGWFTLPNVKVQKKDETPHDPGRATMREAVFRRMAQELIDQDALDYVVAMSGGVMRELTTLVQLACNEALVTGSARITLPLARQAVATIRNEYQRSLRSEHYQQLRQVHADKRVREVHRVSHQREQGPPEMDLLELLHNLSILEYANEESWWDVHPIVASLL